MNWSRSTNQFAWAFMRQLIINPWWNFINVSRNNNVGMGGIFISRLTFSFKAQFFSVHHWNEIVHLGGMFGRYERQFPQKKICTKECVAFSYRFNDINQKLRNDLVMCGKGNIVSEAYTNHDYCKLWYVAANPYNDLTSPFSITGSTRHIVLGFSCP